GLKVIQIDEVTNFPEILDGRVKTLNPYIHGGILYKRDNEKHVNTVNEHKIGAIDLVVVNLYDFEGNLKDNKPH
ncbi:bifunctional phosphoribosylaminoimidazolecarboxamide formyltransferase/IMP cyclohydrolase, partial [Bacteroides intestinalis]|nr:bifunctional phosphoribosylaminoimidazolecarboxamide formyltransferase/IMP cyclohydrolase [Bacteroides intestinalis]